MRLFSNKLFLGGLIGCLVLIIGVFLFIQLKADKSIQNRITPDVSVSTMPTSKSKTIQLRLLPQSIMKAPQSQF